MKTNEEWLYELGYDAREDLDDEGPKMAAFMRQLDREILMEAQRYISFIEDVSDDHYIQLKLNTQQSSFYRKPFDPIADSIIIYK